MSPWLIILSNFYIYLTWILTDAYGLGGKYLKAEQMLRATLNHKFLFALTDLFTPFKYETLQLGDNTVILLDLYQT